ncbi:MAG: hypothetical protein FJW95_10375, partial [Actinobacteria bacterium]|nr:hypothetical protein [Actinomycetota bacterium]
VTRTFVDRDRRTPADPSAGILAAPRRMLPTTIYYPARGSLEAGSLTPDAPPARGAHPLVLFNPGSPGTPEDYEALLVEWAAHGYVVAALEFPISSVAGPDDAAWEDLPAQTKDARFVLDRVLDLDPEKAGIPEIDDDHIAAAGHSFGGATALSLASECCRDDRIDAVLALAAVTVTEAGPALKQTGGPILFVHARSDRAVSWGEAVALCRKTAAPKRFLTIEEIRGLRAHVIPFLGEGDEYSAIARPAMVDFLDGYVLDRKGARARLERAGAGTDIAGLTRCPADPEPTPTTTPTSAAPR